MSVGLCGSGVFLAPMSPSRADALEIIYEDEETDEGALSIDGGTSLYGHPDHEHHEEEQEQEPQDVANVRALEAENDMLREYVDTLRREVELADAEMARWRSRCRNIEDERDALSRELDRFKAELERRAPVAATTRAPQTNRPQSMVVYSTSRETFDTNEAKAQPTYSPPQQLASPRRSSSPFTSSSPSHSPPAYFTHARALPPGAAQPFTSAQSFTRSPPVIQSRLPSISISPTREPTPPGAGLGVPTHRGRLAVPRISRSPAPQTTPVYAIQHSQANANAGPQQGAVYVSHGPALPGTRQDTLNGSHGQQVGAYGAQGGPVYEMRESPVVYSSGNDAWNEREQGQGALPPVLYSTDTPSSATNTSRTSPYTPGESPIVYSSNGAREGWGYFDMPRQAERERVLQQQEVTSPVVYSTSRQERDQQTRDQVRDQGYGARSPPPLREGSSRLPRHASSPLVHSTSAPQQQNEGSSPLLRNGSTNPNPNPARVFSPLAPTTQTMPARVSSPLVQTNNGLARISSPPALYSSAYPHPNGHGQGREWDGTIPGGNVRGGGDDGRPKQGSTLRLVAGQPRSQPPQTQPDPQPAHQQLKVEPEPSSRPLPIQPPRLKPVQPVRQDSGSTLSSSSHSASQDTSHSVALSPTSAAPSSSASGGPPSLHNLDNPSHTSFPRTLLDPVSFDFNQNGKSRKPALSFPDPAISAFPDSTSASGPFLDSTLSFPALSQVQLSPFSPTSGSPSPFPSNTQGQTPKHEDDPEFGPVIVHGPLPPRHQQLASPSPVNVSAAAFSPIHASFAGSPASTSFANSPVHTQAHAFPPAPQKAPRRKREPVSVPPRHLGGSAFFGGGKKGANAGFGAVGASSATATAFGKTGGGGGKKGSSSGTFSKSSVFSGVGGSATFGGAAMGMGGGMALGAGVNLDLDASAGEDSTVWGWRR